MFCYLWFNDGSEMQYKGKQARLFPYFKHSIVHLMIIFCTYIDQVINLYLFTFHLDCFHVKCIYTRREGGKKSLEVQNPKEYLRYKYTYPLNNNLYHALSMFKNTVDMYTCFFNRMVYTTYNLTN